jgi:hypothetical protein
LNEDLIQLELLLGLANDHGMVLPPDMITDIAALDAQASGLFARTASCGACAVDITACKTLAQIGACAVPFELSPAGDLNAVRRASVSYLSGEAVDQFDLGLAIVGLGATGSVLATGGTSYTVKAGTSVLRMARRLGAITPAFAARLGDLTRQAIRWDRIEDLAALGIGPADMINATQMAELTAIGTSVRRVATKTSMGEAVSLLLHVDSAEDAVRLARVTDAVGPKARGAFEVLGKTRVLRATVRLSDLAFGAVTLLYLTLVQIGVLVAQLCRNACMRALRRRMQRAPI